MAELANSVSSMSAIIGPPHGLTCNVNNYYSKMTMTFQNLANILLLNGCSEHQLLEVRGLMSLGQNSAVLIVTSMLKYDMLTAFSP